MLIGALAWLIKSFLSQWPWFTIIIILYGLPLLSLIYNLRNKTSWEIITLIISNIRVYKDILIKVLVVEIFKGHRSTLKRLSYLFVSQNFNFFLFKIGKLFTFEFLNFCTLLEEYCSGNLRVWKQFPIVFNLIHTFKSILCIFLSHYIRITLTLFDRMPDLLAAKASLNLLVLGSVFVFNIIIIFFVVIVLDLMLLYCATFLVLAFLTTAPPHFSFSII